MPTVIIMAKRPLPGRVKTRLCPPLAAAEAARLAAAFLHDLGAALATLPGVVTELALPAQELEESAFPAAAGCELPALPLVAQCGQDLGERLQGALASAWERRPGVVAVVGSDHPNLPMERVLHALELAASGTYASIPTEDGGFALLACPRPLPELLAAIPWSTPRVDDALRANASALGIVLTNLEPWYDVDVWADVARLARDLRGSEHCPQTQRALAQLELPFIPSQAETPE